MNDMDKGLYNKYAVFKRDTGEPLDGACFVLRPDRDTAARAALLKYADCTVNLELARDIKDWVYSLLRAGDYCPMCGAFLIPWVDGNGKPIGVGCSDCDWCVRQK